MNHAQCICLADEHHSAPFTYFTFLPTITAQPATRSWRRHRTPRRPPAAAAAAEPARRGQPAAQAS
jgi:hypothetical protein